MKIFDIVLNIFASVFTVGMGVQILILKIPDWLVFIELISLFVIGAALMIVDWVGLERRINKKLNK